jgi:hypothetical protein
MPKIRVILSKSSGGVGTHGCGVYLIQCNHEVVDEITHKVTRSGIATVCSGCTVANKEGGHDSIIWDLESLELHLEKHLERWELTRNDLDCALVACYPAPEAIPSVRSVLKDALKGAYAGSGGHKSGK